MNEKCINTIQKFGWLFRLAEWKLKVIKAISPIAPLFLRLWMADVFWKSAILKLPTGFLGIGKGDWDNTILLFEYEHPVPFLSPEVAAFLGTGFELLCPILLVVGFGTRTAAFILLIMTAFIQITYFQHVTHIYWMILLGVLVLQGGGKLSLDSIFRKKLLRSECYKQLSGLEK